MYTDEGTRVAKTGKEQTSGGGHANDNNIVISDDYYYFFFLLRFDELVRQRPLPSRAGSFRIRHTSHYAARNVIRVDKNIFYTFVRLLFKYG